MSIPRALNPQTNPAGYIATAGALYAAVTMIYNAYHHHGVIDTGVILAAIAAVSTLFSRTLTTPTADPKDGAGRPLVPAADPAAGHAPAPPS